MGSGQMRPYERRRVGALAGSVGTTPPSFPVALTSDQSVPAMAAGAASNLPCSRGRGQRVHAGSRAAARARPGDRDDGGGARLHLRSGIAPGRARDSGGAAAAGGSRRGHQRAPSRQQRRRVGPIRRRDVGEHRCGRAAHDRLHTGGELGGFPVLQAGRRHRDLPAVARRRPRAVPAENLEGREARRRQREAGKPSATPALCLSAEGASREGVGACGNTRARGTGPTLAP